MLHPLAVKRVNEGYYTIQAWHDIPVEKIQELQANHRENTGDSYQNTGENCHFTGNIEITGGRARPALSQRSVKNLSSSFILVRG